MKHGAPTSENFLVRSRELFAAAGYNVAIVGKPSDREELDERFRIGAEHVADLRVIVEKVRRDQGKPVWLVGTSRGTISAAAGAAALDPSRIAGIVLTSSVTNGKRANPVPLQIDLSAIRVPVLVMHHQRRRVPQCATRARLPCIDGRREPCAGEEAVARGGRRRTDAAIRAKRCIGTATSAWSRKPSTRSRTGSAIPRPRNPRAPCRGS